VTGATGTVGKDVAAQLAERGIEVRRAVLPADTETTHGPGTTVAFDFTDPATHGDALDGVDRVFLMRPPPMSNVKRDMRPFVNAMAQRPIRLVAFLSLMGVNRAMPHWQIEHDLRCAGIPASMLRPSFFTQNVSGAYRADIAVHDRIRLPAGSGRTSFVDTRDVAAVAAAALADPDRHAGSAYTVTGDRAYTDVRHRAEHVARVVASLDRAQLQRVTASDSELKRSVGELAVRGRNP
jgi:uncharacterized protein YbjT (DUF2867 family)